MPVVAGGRLAGMLYVESPQDHRFGYDDEDALATIATQLGLAMQHLQAAEAQDEPPRRARARRAGHRGADRACGTTRPTTASSSATTT